jgi:hypothetical protein
MTKYAFIGALLIAAAICKVAAFGDVIKDVIELADNKNRPSADFETQVRWQTSWLPDEYLDHQERNHRVEFTSKGVMIA